MGQAVAGRYRLVALLGAGATGHTWRAHDAVEAREVALKRVASGAGPEQVASLRTEFELLRGLHHPHLAQIFDFGVEPGGAAYHTRALVDGHTLEGRPRVGALLDALEALAFLHSLEVLHGDFKPANVIVRDDGSGVLIDLGGARRGRVPAGAPVTGTRGYVAPELLAGRGGGVSADVYSFGRTLARVAPDTLEGRVGDAVAEDPGARPSAAELLEALGRQAPVAAPNGRSASLVGRSEALARWDAALAALAAGGAPEEVSVAGPPGLGKTRLLREMSWRAQPRFDVLWLGPARLRRGLEASLGVEGIEPMLAALEVRARPLVALVDDADELDDDERLLLGALRACPPCLLAVGSREGDAALPPLDADAIATWAPWLTAEDARRVHAATGGHPADVELALASLATGAATDVDLVASGGVTLAISDEAQRALASLLAGCPVETPAWLELQRAGWVRFESGRPRLARPSRARALEAALGDRVRDAHRAALDAPTLTAPERVVHLAGAGDRAAARASLAAARAAWAAEPRAWRRAIDAAQPTGALAARAWSAVGQPTLALAALVDQAKREPEGLSHPETRRELGVAYLLLGDLSRARRHLRRADASDPDTADALARTLVRAGEPAEARRVAEEALARGTAEPSTDASLREVAALAALYLGDLERARQGFAEGARRGTPRERARRSSYEGIARSRAGDVAGAHESFSRALAIAEQAGIADSLASGVLNVATSAQRLGRWGDALTAYARALRLARALAKRTTAATIRFNVANLRLAIGDLGFVESQLDVIRADIEACGLESLRPSVAILEGELHAQRLDHASAKRAFAEALDLARAQGAAREALEAELGLAGVDPDPVTLRALLERSRAQGATDLEARALALLGQVESGANAAAGLERIERAAAAASGEPALEAEILGQAATLAAHAGAEALAAEHRERARQRWERIALTLAPEDRARFWRHPRRQRDAAPETGAAEGPALTRVLEINRDLNASLAAESVLSRALDAAIELTHAERGFVLERVDDELRVAVARNLDRERIGRSHLKFSRSIAEDVIRAGRPVMTSDAGADERFRTNQSVLAMRLRSVACVPIIGRDGVMGAIYVDNRFERGRFRDDAGRLLAAFADQVAVALTNARLHADLTARTRELERERARVEKLLEERDREIERLTTSAPRASELRYDFGELVGQSPAMRRVLATLERVIDSPLSVLIQGESGTGKELVARAVHDLGPRRGAPFVSLNCGAVPAPLLESELFGHVRGAFTGAERDREGLLSRARGGTVFLDEVGEMPPSMQVKLLRVLQERVVRPVGGEDEVELDIRLLAATNRDLRTEVEAGRFRQDLYYRIAVVDVTVPPLRERLDDLPTIARALLARHARELGREGVELDRGALRKLLRHRWPGNVRELENVLSRALVMAPKEATLGARDLELNAPQARPRSRAEHDARERELILAELEATGWNVSEVSRRLEIPRNTLYRRMKRYGVRR